MPARYEFEGRWECHVGTSNKFYEIHTMTDNDFHCTWGRIGQVGKSIRYSWDRVQKKVRAFRSKGYRQMGRGVRPENVTLQATEQFEPVDVNARLGAVGDLEEEADKPVVTKKKAKKKAKVKKFVPTGRLSSVE